MQACLFQPSERQQLADMLQQPEHAAALHQNCATEMALLAASHAEWERYAAAAVAWAAASVIAPVELLLPNDMRTLVSRL